MTISFITGRKNRTAYGNPCEQDGGRVQQIDVSNVVKQRHAPDKLLEGSRAGITYFLAVSLLFGPAAGIDVLPAIGTG